MSVTALHVATFGHGHDVVLVHGWGFSGTLLQPLATALAEHHRVHVIDLPGHGGSRDVALAGTFEGLAAQLAESIPDRAAWLGWSLGGMACLRLALDQPERVTALALIAATPRFTRGPGWREALDGATLAAFADGLQRDRTATLARFAGLVAHGDDEPHRVARCLRVALAEFDPLPTALATGLDLLANGDLRAEASRLAVPLLCLLGARDALLPASVAPHLQTLWPRAAVEVIDGAGHAPFLGHGAAACHKRLMAFLDE